MASSSYLDGVWEWIQVKSDHVASHYALLVAAYSAVPAAVPMHPLISDVAPPEECSLHVTMPSAQLSHKG